MIWIALTIGWGIAAALVGALVAVGLNRWVAGWSLAKRVFIAVAAATSPSFGIVGYYMAQLGLISFWFSADEFLVSFALHIAMIVAISAPIAWLISRRTPRKTAPLDVFD